MTKITAHDVMSVASKANIKFPTSEQIQFVLEQYESSQNENADEAWYLVVEKLLYFINTLNKESHVLQNL